METNGKTTFGSTLKVDVTSAQDATGAIFMAYQRGEVEVIELEPKEPYYLTNEQLKETYEAMHRQGPSAWFNDGKEERELILKMGEPWKGLRVLEIGCGEGELAGKMSLADAGWVFGVDYSEVAIQNAILKTAHISGTEPSRTTHLYFKAIDWRNISSSSWAGTVDDDTIDRIVMQGVLEHLDDPFASLDAMIEKFKPKSIITSSPCFLNPRGIVWMTLNMLGAVMSKTDLHFLNPWQFEEFCEVHKGYYLQYRFCDDIWGSGFDMVKDYRDRIWKALRDGGIPYDQTKLAVFLDWITRACPFFVTDDPCPGATAVYRFDL